MVMKKKRILFGCLIAAFSLSVSACDLLPENLFSNFNKRSSSEETSQRSSRSSRSSTSKSSSTHVHTFSEDWEFNESSHWHPSTCGHNVKSEVTPHEYYSVVTKKATCMSQGEIVEVCTVCDYRRTRSTPASDHVWTIYDRVEPTCEEPGMYRKICSACGTTTTEYVDPLGHNYVTQSYTAPTCSRSGSIREVCSRCGDEYYSEIPASQHTWSEETYYSSEGQEGEGMVSYSLRTCAVCGASRIAINALECQDPSIFKTGTSYDFGFVKLNKNGASVTYSFNYPFNAFGKMYQHGIFENPYSSSAYSNNSYTYGAQSPYQYNFQVSVNNQNIDLYQASLKTYQEMLIDGEYIEGLTDNNFSPAGDCLIGDVSLTAGINTFTYTRTGSYNLCVDRFVFDVYNSEHVHTKSASWYFDDNSHWFNCIDPNCPVPNTRIDTAAHTFGAPAILTQVTCHSDGLQRETCTVCGYHRDTVLPATDHIFEAIGSLEPAEGSAGLDEYGCTTCDTHALRWSALQYDQSLSQYVDASSSEYVRFQSGMAENRNGVEQVGAHIIYRLNIPIALNNVGLAFNVSQSSSYIFDVASQGSSDNGYIYQNGELVQSTKKYGLRVNDVEIQLGDDLYGKSSSSSSPSWYNWPVRFNLNAGINTIDIYCLSGSYRGRMYEFQITDTPYIEPNHAHTPSTEYYSDANYHYHTCTSGDGAKMDLEPHRFGEYITVTEPTCTEYGTTMRKCAVCGYEEYNSVSPNGHVWGEGVATSGSAHDAGSVIYTCLVCGETKTVQNAMQHDFDESRTWYAVNSQNVEYSVRYCSTCNKEVQSIPFANGNVLSGGYSSGKLSSGTSMQWKFPVRTTGFISIYIPCKMTSGNTNQTFDPSLYNISVNGVNTEILMPKGTYNELGITSSETNYFKWAEIDVSNLDLIDGEIEITFTSNVSSYRMIFDGEIRLEY